MKFCHFDLPATVVHAQHMISLVSAICGPILFPLSFLVIINYIIHRIDNLKYRKHYFFWLNKIVYTMILTYFLHDFSFFQRKQNSKVYTSKNPHAQLWSSHANTGRKEVTVANQRQKNDMTKSVPMGHHRDINDDFLKEKKTPSTKRRSPTKDASYLTKEQLSKILSSISGQESPASQQGLLLFNK